MKIIDDVRTGEDRRCLLKISFDEIGNLNSSTLEMLINSLGLDYSRFSTKRNLIDEGLVRRRNRIAHGQYQSVTIETFEDTLNAVIEMIDDIRTQIENAVILGTYRRED